MAKLWRGPRSYFGSIGEALQFGDCICCGCLSQSGTASVDDNDLDPESTYDRFKNGARVKLIIADIPASFSYQLVTPIETNGFGEQYQSVTSVTITGLDNLNGTRLVSLPLSQYKCLWPRRNIYTEQIDITYDVSVQSIITSNNCTTSFSQTDNSNVTAAMTLSVGVYKKVFPAIETAAGGSGSPFRYVLVRLDGWDCFTGAPNIFYPRLGLANLYWPYVTGEYALSSGINDPASQCGTGIGIDGKRISNVASGSFQWAEATSAPSLAITNDPTRSASLCSLSGSGDISDVTGSVGSYSMEIERL